MKQLSDVIEAAASSEVDLPVVLRKFLIVAYKLQNERLLEWIRNELNGYPDQNELPDYRVLSQVPKGYFVGPMNQQIDNQPLPTFLLDEKHRNDLTKARLEKPISEYDHLSKSDTSGVLRGPWPGNLVVYYQEAFFEGRFALNRAWNELSVASVAAVVDVVRNRVLEFALELQQEIGDTEEPLEAVSEEKIADTVNNYIFGATNVIAGGVRGDAQQVGNVSQGDQQALIEVLTRIGLKAPDVEALETAINEDKEAGEPSGLGAKTKAWLGNAVLKVGQRGAEIVGETAQTTLTKVVMDYLGLG